MELVPCWIRVFDKYDNCRRFKEDPGKKKPEEIQGYYAIAYICYKKACDRFEEINKEEIEALHEDENNNDDNANKENEQNKSQGCNQNN